MNFLSFFFMTLFAVETIVSPLPDYAPSRATHSSKPITSFGKLLSMRSVASNVLGVSTSTTVPVVSVPPVSVTKKSSYAIAVLGDSMVDTLGPGVPHLAAILSDRYPGVLFTVQNFGVGATNIDYGIERIASGYTYLAQQIPSIASQNPDIVIVESFGYNPYSMTHGALDRHWLALAKAVDAIRLHIPKAKIIIAATIAPNVETFGDGAAGISFSQTDKRERVNVIKTYLDNAVRFAQSQKLPVADAYHESLDSAGNGRDEYINAGDHIHYSDAGRVLFAAKVADAIKASNLLN